MDYDRWKTGYDDYVDDSYSKKCNECVDINQKFDESVEFLEGIRDQLYGYETFDREIVDHCLSELFWRFNVKEPKTQLKINSFKTRENKIFDFTLQLSKRLNEKKFITLYN